MKYLISIFLLISTQLFALEIGSVPKTITLQGDDGGYVADNKAWSSSMLQGNIFVMFYVDPDKKDVNEPFAQELKAFKKENNLTFQSIAIINLAATWKPDFIIESVLKEKQKQYPTTLYVKDKNSVLVREWEVDDDASDIIIFGQDGKVLFYKSGPMDAVDTAEALRIIKENS